MDDKAQHEFTLIKQAWNRWATFAAEHGVKVSKTEHGYGSDVFARLRELKGPE